MINLKDDVLQALESNSALISLLGGNWIWQLTVPEDHRDKFPRITFFEITNFDSEFADDKETVSDIHMQVDVWSKGSTTVIASEIDKTMKSLGFFRTSAGDFYEEDTQIYHKSMRYKIRKQIEGVS